MSQQLPEAAAELLRTPLTVEQRLELIGELWDSIPDSLDALPVPEWHREDWNVDWLPMLIRTLQSRGHKSKGDFAKIFLHEIRGWFEQRTATLILSCDISRNLWGSHYAGFER